jgi:hypothetical protein
LWHRFFFFSPIFMFFCFFFVIKNHKQQVCWYALMVTLCIAMFPVMVRYVCFALFCYSLPYEVVSHEVGHLALGVVTGHKFLYSVCTFLHLAYIADPRSKQQRQPAWYTLPLAKHICIATATEWRKSSGGISLLLPSARRHATRLRMLLYFAGNVHALLLLF